MLFIDCLDVVFSLCFLTFGCGFLRKVNGPGTPRPLNRPKLSLANSLAANGLPDSTDDKDLLTEQQEDDDKDSRYAGDNPVLPLKETYRSF